MQKGFSHLEAGNYEEALEEYLSAIRMEEFTIGSLPLDIGKVYYNIGLCHKNLYEKEGYDFTHLNNALAYFNRSVEVYKKVPTDHARKAIEAASEMFRQLSEKEY